MDERVHQFHTDSQKPLSPATVKEIERLRKFLFKNQEYRFSEREQSWLFSAVQTHYSNYPSSNDGDNPALSLLDDALKMPFTVFTTSHKKTMLKWHAKLTGQAGNGDANAAGKAAGQSPHARLGEKCNVIDVTADVMQVMNDDGDTFDIPRTACDACMAAQVADAFAQGSDVNVRVTGEGTHRIISAVL